MAPCKIDCNENGENMFIDVDGGEASINFSENCNIVARNTKLVINHSKKVKLNVKDSAFSLNNGDNVRADGDHITLHGENFTDCLMNGANNCVTVQNSNDVILSGSSSSLILIKSQHPKVFGMGNMIAGKSNKNLIVCGHENGVAAEENKDLKVLGHDNQVAATRTQRVSIEGNKHKVFLEDVVVSHKITKTSEETNNEPDLITDNEINFIGIPTRCPIFGDILHQERQRILVPLSLPSFSRKNSENNEGSNASNNTKHNSLGTAEAIRCVCENFFKEYEQQKNLSMTIPVFPQVHIRYTDKAIISNEDYTIGIFHVQVTGLFEIHQRDLRVKVRVLADKLDGGTYTSLMSPSDRKNVTFAGSKNGKKQTLRLTGNHITENADKSFSVSFFEETEASAHETANMEEDILDTENAEMNREIMDMNDYYRTDIVDMDDDSLDSDMDSDSDLSDLDMDDDSSHSDME